MKHTLTAVLWVDGALSFTRGQIGTVVATVSSLSTICMGTMGMDVVL